MSMGMDGVPVPVWVTPEAEVPQFGTEDWVSWLVTHPGLADQCEVRTHRTLRTGYVTPTEVAALVLEVPGHAWQDVVGSLVDYYRRNMGGQVGPVPVQYVGGRPWLDIGGLNVAAQHAPPGAATWDPATGWADGKGRTL